MNQARKLCSDQNNTFRAIFYFDNCTHWYVYLKHVMETSRNKAKQTHVHTFKVKQVNYREKRSAELP